MSETLVCTAGHEVASREPGSPCREVVGKRHGMRVYCDRILRPADVLDGEWHEYDARCCNWDTAARRGICADCRRPGAAYMRWNGRAMLAYCPTCKARRDDAARLCDR